MSATARGFTSAELIAEQQRGVANLYGTQESDLHRLLAQPISFSDKERSIILQTCCGGASPDEAKQLIAIAEARGLNPIKGECFFVKRWDNAKKQEVWSVQASIDSFRIKADETGLYDGQDEPEYQYDDHGKLLLAKVRVWRKGIARPFVGVARFEEYVQTARDKQTGNERPTKFWARMPHNQLAKCAEALAFRKAFPARFARVYTPEEMAQADNDLAAPEHDPDTGAGEVLEQHSASNQQDSRVVVEMHLQRIAACVSLDDWRQVTEAIKADAGKIGKTDLAYLRAMAKQKKIDVMTGDSEPPREPGSDDV